MMYKVNYWGGPKDGESIDVPFYPETIEYWQDQVTSVDKERFDSTLRNNKRRSVDYHEYKIDQVDENIITFKFIRLV